jgi:hypothetical protein
VEAVVGVHEALRETAHVVQARQIEFHHRDVRAGMTDLDGGDRGLALRSVPRRQHGRRAHPRQLGRCLEPDPGVRPGDEDGPSGHLAGHLALHE